MAAVLAERRKQAYREILYWAILHLRRLAWIGPTRFQSWNPWFWRRVFHRIRYCGRVADWLHNLAQFSALDFDNFDEDWFWREWENLAERYPDLSEFRSHFDRVIAEQE